MKGECFEIVAIVLHRNAQECVVVGMCWRLAGPFAKAVPESGSSAVFDENVRKNSKTVGVEFQTCFHVEDGHKHWNHT